MKLVEAESIGPVEGEEATVTPPRPPHRRVSVSLLFTLTVLIGTVVAIYMVFPARNDVVLREAFARHAESAPAWDLAAPSGAEARAWTYGVVGKDAPLPRLDAPARVVGVRRIELLDHPAAVLRVELGGAPVTYVVQRSPVGAPTRVERARDGLHGVGWRGDGFTTAAVGPVGAAAAWQPLLPH